MNFDACPHHNHPNFLSQEGIFCRLCNAFRQLAALSQHSMLAMAIEKLSSWTIRSPSINGLPHETLIEIFQHYLGMGDTIYKGDDSSHITTVTLKNSTPVLLTHVCQAWRQLIRSTPLMWSSLAIHNPRHKHIPLIRMWLDFAESCLLSINIRHGLHDYPERNSATNAILLLLVDRGHLWKSVDFLFWNTQPALTNIPAGSLSVLEHASLDIITGPATYNDNAWTILHSSPRLSSVTWNNLFTPFAHAPWEQLKIIECLISLPLDGLLDSLHSCRNLEVLIMKSGVSDANLPQLITRSITLPALKQLQLHHLRDGFSTLFNAISAPQLTMVKFYSVNPGPIDLLAFKDFIRRSKCMLSSFRLGSDSMTATESLEWLETPGLSNASDVQMFIKPDIKLYDPHIKIDPNQTYVEAIVAKAKKFVSQYESCSV